ncbi:unnamed protein product [Ceutorhynchus assimilis]|uniref:alpha-glucosidase n=1 Tax=Ceutorhynchus assimilis TaxID=467358 RepID=A0A9P0GT61_9CUCU|nr:unnamed protein product [Ceutorhynchus assimilis]
MKLITVASVLALISTSTCKTIQNGLYSDWWQNAVLYQIYPRSFKDSNNDGNGDLQGIISKLDHLQDMNIDGIWLSPIYKSPQVDNGYDIADFRSVDELYGTLDDLKQLLDEVHKRNLKLILDYVPNHTSDQHKWFQASLNKDPQYDDYYIWRNASYVNGIRKEPNNWLSAFGGSAWEWNNQRQQYYFHQFSTGQPDLNYRNPLVVKEMKDVLRYWLDFGVDGFRMDAVFTLFEDVTLPDEPLSGETDDPNSYGYLSHIYTSNLNETVDMIYQWRDVLDEYSINYTRIMMTEVYSDVNNTMRYYVNEDYSRYGAHFSFNFNSFVTGLKQGFNAVDLYGNITIWTDNLPNNCTSNWVLGNHDQTRVSTRLGIENIDALNMLVSILPGVQITYQGEEIGQENGEVNCTQGYDPQAIKNCSTYAQLSRDFERTPYQWDNTTNAGFNEGNQTWLPVSEKYLQTNLAIERNSIKSHYNIYKTLVDVKKQFKVATSDALYLADWDKEINVFYIERQTDFAHYAVIFNVNDEKIKPPLVIHNKVEVVVGSLNSQYNPGDVFDFTRPLNPKESILLKITH